MTPLATLISYPPERRLVYCAVSILGVGMLTGALVSSAALLSRLHSAQNTTEVLQNINNLQAAKISSMAAQLAIASVKSLEVKPSVVVQNPAFALGPVPSLPASNAEFDKTTQNKQEPPIEQTTNSGQSAPQQPASVAQRPEIKAPVKAVFQPPKPVARTQASSQTSSQAAPTTPATSVALPTTGLSAPGVTVATVKPTTPDKEAKVTLEQAGIVGLDTAGVRFKSGRQVTVGSEFPSGERLISVSPQEGRIVTDRRIILLAKPEN